MRGGPVWQTKLIRHWDEYSNEVSGPQIEQEPDKSKSISDLSMKELYKMAERIRNEIELQDLIRTMKRNSGERDTYEKPFEIDTQTPINQLYHFGILGQKWGFAGFKIKMEHGPRREKDGIGKKQPPQRIIWSPK